MLAPKFMLIYASSGVQCLSRVSTFKSKQAAQKYLTNDFGFGADDIIVMTEQQRQKKYGTN